MNNGCLNRVFSARSALMTKSSRRHHGIHHRRHNLYFFFVITACCFSQRTSPAEQLVRRQSMSSRYRTDRVAARYDYRAMTSLSRKTRCRRTGCLAAHVEMILTDFEQRHDRYRDVRPRRSGWCDERRQSVSSLLVARESP